ncbi:MAG: DOMON-like domain-containing protein [Sphingobium sp.]
MDGKQSGSRAGDAESSRILPLICHPDTPCGADVRLSVAVDRGMQGALGLRYRVEGDVEKLIWPSPAPPARADGLWQAGCLELFVRDARHADRYREHNFAPSRAWAAYDFSGYRAGMDNADMPAPDIAPLPGEGRFDLAVHLHLPTDDAVMIGLSAVVQERGGAISYWALAHPPGKPDFHHPACFACELPPPRPS